MPDPRDVLRSAGAQAAVPLDLAAIQQRSRRYRRARRAATVAATALPVLVLVSGLLLRTGAEVDVSPATQPVPATTPAAPPTLASAPVPSTTAPPPRASRPPSMPSAPASASAAPAPASPAPSPAPPSPAPAAQPPPPPEVPPRVLVEAEQGQLRPPMRAVADATASGGSFVQVPKGAGADREGGVDLVVEIPVAGDYLVWARVRAPSSGSNSVHVVMDDGPSFIWHVPHVPPEGDGPGPWVWAAAERLDAPEPMVYRLEAGSHVLGFTNRETGFAVDRVLLTADRTVRPQD